MKVLQTGYQSMPIKKRYSIYVINLDPAVLKHRKFREANPHYDYESSKPCAYVGETELTPDERFKEHKSGYRKPGIGKWHNTYAKNYGRWLCRKQFKKENERGIGSKSKAKKLEAKKAAELRDKGWAVWYN